VCVLYCVVVFVFVQSFDAFDERIRPRLETKKWSENLKRETERIRMGEKREE
jgi:hypothetical protein